MSAAILALPWYVSGNLGRARIIKPGLFIRECTSMILKNEAISML